MVRFDVDARDLARGRGGPQLNFSEIVRNARRHPRGFVESETGCLGARRGCFRSLDIRQVVAESKKLFEGTVHENDFFIWHDALSQWWETEAQEYMAKLGFRDRQVRCLGATNAGSRYYEGKLVGDSPELMPLDAHLFSDLQAALWLHVSLTSKLPVGDARRFETGTPRAISSAVRRAWEIAPTSVRIVEDCSSIPARVGRIIEAKGVAVQDIFLRSGRRYISASGDAQLKNKPRKRQRLSTLKSPDVHPDARSSFESLSSTFD